MESRQQRWQKRKKAEGKCIGCGEERGSKSMSYCDTCRENMTEKHNVDYHVKHPNARYNRKGSAPA